jgi:very-short-patch-repair endonuclease
MNEIFGVIQEEHILQEEITKEENLMTDLFNDHWKGHDADLDYLEIVTDFLAHMHKEINEQNLPEAVKWYFVNHPSGSRLQDIQKQAIDLLTAYVAQTELLLQKIQLSWKLGRKTEAPFIFDSFEKQEKKLDTWLNNLDKLQEIITLKGLLGQLREKNLNSVINVALLWDEAGTHFVNSFEQFYYQELLHKALKERAELAQFDGSLHEHDIEKFCDLDTRLLEINRILLALKHWSNLPHHQAVGQLGILTHEFAKKRRHKPIRRLMREAGNVIQAIKPIFMMSPLSIAMFLPPNTIEFDLVIFDEASQVEPVDAFGAILRGKQVVIAGDDKQLPPTTFFESGYDVDEDNTDSITIDLESILGLSVAQGMPQRMLRWHYRSEHESLIAVSNQEFYDENLVIFPSPDKEKTSLGLVYHHLPETTYARGKSRTNIGEAKTIAQAVFQHAESSPELTLGVAAFSSSQANAIRDQLEILRRQDPTYEDFFHSHPEERFFIKNLENVQGDERDIIFISIGYGWTPSGTVSMNFGPLNRSGGERRLNVLITRARKRCEIFTNLLPEDIDLTRTNAVGVRVLKQYLTYARDGNMDIPISTGKGPDSPFEAEVAKQLRDRGYRVDHQIGAAGFFIDLAVLDEDHPGQYILGIECDGASYHSAKSARDRDRLRQFVLEDLGWTIHRVWSTDWFRHQHREIDKLIESIEKARKIDKQKKHKEGDSQKAETKNFSIKRRKIKKKTKKTIKVNPYQICNFNIQGYTSNLHTVSNRTMASWIKEVVAVESPVHKDEAARRILDAAGVKRFGRRIKEKFEKGVRAAVDYGFVIRKGNFLWKDSQLPPKIRSREKASESSRDLEVIAPEEIQAAIIEVIKISYGISQDELVKEVCSIFGFGRVSSQMNSIIIKNIQTLKDKHEITNENGFLTANDQ